MAGFLLRRSICGAIALVVTGIWLFCGTGELISLSGVSLIEPCGPLLVATSLEQRVVPRYNHWSGFAARFGTFNRRNKGFIEVTVFDADNKRYIHSQNINMENVSDNSLVRITFNPVPDSARRQFVIFMRGHYHTSAHNTITPFVSQFFHDSEFSALWNGIETRKVLFRNMIYSPGIWRFPQLLLLFTSLAMFLAGDARLWRWCRRPERVFAVVAGGSALVLVWLVPPLQIPDEQQHFQKAYAVSRGRLGCRPMPGEPNKRTITLLEQVDNAAIQFRARKFDPKIFPDEIPGKIRCGMLKEQVFGYFFTLYSASGLAFALAALFDFSIGVTYYMGRCANIIFYIFTLFWAIKIAPRFKFFILLAALSPMALYEGFSLAADSFSYAAIVFFFAYFMRLYDAKKPYSTGELVIFALLLLHTALCKNIYVPLCLAVFLLPVRNFASPGKFWRYSLILFGVCMAGTFCWAFANPSFLYSGANVGDQIGYVLRHPLNYAAVLGKSIFVQLPVLWDSSVGVLGWFDLTFDRGFYWLYGAVWGAALLCLRERGSYGALTRGVAAAAFVGVVVLSYTAMYVVANPVGHGIIYGVQGRYLLPAVPFLFILFGHGEPTGRRFDRVCRILLVFFIIYMQLAMFDLIACRYWY